MTLQLVPLHVCAAMPTTGGDWACLLWLDDGRRSWWARV